MIAVIRGPVCEATVATMTQRAADGLDDFLGHVGDRLAEAEVAGFDETGLRVAGTLHWSALRPPRQVHPDHLPPQTRHGRYQNDAGVLGRFHGVAVHDAWAPYDSYLNVAHQLCCAHALRELQGVADLAAPEQQWRWADQAADALVAMQRLVADALAAGADTVDPDALGTQIQLYRSAAQIEPPWAVERL